MNIEVEKADLALSDEMKLLKAEKVRRDIYDILEVAHPKTKNIPTEGGESYFWKSQEELSTILSIKFGIITDKIYLTLCNYLGLPIVSSIRKSLIDDVRKLHSEDNLIIKGKVAFSPETGKPLKKKDFDRLIITIERFLNKNLKNTDKEIVLNNYVLGNLLAKLSTKNTEDLLRLLPQEEISYHDNPLPWYVEDPGRLELNPVQEQQIDLATRAAGEYITKISNSTKALIRETYANSLRSRDSSSRMSQQLFDKFGSLNKDWDRIIEYEGGDSFNNAYLQESFDSTKDNYFIRYEVLDGHTCPFCQDIKGKIVLMAEDPQESTTIDNFFTDTVIWTGLNNVGRKRPDWIIPAGPVHPRCRGGWTKYTPPDKDDKASTIISSFNDRIDAKTKEFDTARIEAIKNGYEKDSNEYAQYIENRVKELEGG